MKRKLTFLIPAFSFITLLTFHSSAMADDWDQKTLFSINQPVSVPGHVVLPAGSYIIKRLDATSPVVQILNSTETKVFATLLTNLDAVSNPPDKPMFTFEEMPEGTLALKTWYYPGRDTAYEFVTEKTLKSE